MPAAFSHTLWYRNLLIVIIQEMTQMRSIHTHEFRVLMALQKHLSVSSKSFRCHEVEVNCREFRSFGCAVIDPKELPRPHPTNAFAACAPDARY